MITPARSRRWTRSATAGEDRFTRRPSSARETRPSLVSSPMILRSVESSFRRLSAIMRTTPSFLRQATLVPLIRYVHFGRSWRQFRDRRSRYRTGAADRANRRRATARLLRRERDLPLPRPVIRGPALRACRRARRRLAADRIGGARLRRLAPPLAQVRGARSSGATADRVARRGLRRHERLLLHLDRPFAARDGGRDRVHRTDRGGGDRHADLP